MTIKTKFSESDSKLSSLVSRRNLSKGAIKNYNTVFNEIFKLFGVTPSRLVEIGKREQKPFLDEETGQYDILDLENRTVTDYQFKYYNYLRNKKLTDETIKLKINTFRALLGEYDIDKPKPIKINIKNDRIRDEDIVSWREVESAMSFCKGIRDKAIISFIVTTGLRRSDVLRLTIADLVKACKIYFDEFEDETIEVLLSKNPEDIIPCWEIMPSKTSKKSQLCVTFNTPEASTYLWQYLSERKQKYIKKGENGTLCPSEPLFSTSTKKFLKSTAIDRLFQRLNAKLGNKLDKNGKYGRFRSHSLRKLFSTTVRRNITQVVINSDKTSEIDIVSIFTGHLPPNESNSKVYEAIESDSHDSYLRKTYTALVPYLSIQNIEVKDIKTKQYKDLEEKNMQLQKQIDIQASNMQREMDEQQERYEKKLRHLENVNSALTTQINDIQNQVDSFTAKNNITEIQKYIVENELVNEYNLSNKIYELYRLDMDKGLSFIDASYIDTLIARAYNSLPQYRINDIRDDGSNKQTDEEYINLKNKIMEIADKFILSRGFKVSKPQKDSIGSELMDYCDKLWWQHKSNYDKTFIESTIHRIAKKGL